jgi:hypothetical protein
MTVLVVLGVLIAAFIVWRRHRRRAGSSIERNFNVEPPAGRLGKLKGERL